MNEHSTTFEAAHALPNLAACHSHAIVTEGLAKALYHFIHAEGEFGDEIACLAHVIEERCREISDMLDK